jgi:hypothetical protein
VSPCPSDLPQHLKTVHVGRLVALEGLRRARESLDDHVCDAAGSAGGCSLCHLARSLTVVTMRAARAFDAVETGSATLVDGDAVDDAMVGVQEMLEGRQPRHPACVGATPQRAGRN